jgi:hypothetical protein
MAQIPRPPKQGNVTTYVAKVAAGYARILAGEMDADLDTIYGAWNGGADTVNLRDSCVTSEKLAADAVGPREIADGGVFTVALADNAVTTPKVADSAITAPKIVSVPWAKVTDAPTTLPPSGTAGGDLTGSYPSPSIRETAVTAAKIADLNVDTPKLADAAVTRAKLAPGQINGAWVYDDVSSFSTSVLGAWVQVGTITVPTRGANAVLLFTNHGLTGVSAGVPGVVWIRWLRDGTQLCNTALNPNGAAKFSVPSLSWVDIVPAAGSYIYILQTYLDTGAQNVSNVGTTGCNIIAVELG